MFKLNRAKSKDLVDMFKSKRAKSKDLVDMFKLNRAKSKKQRAPHTKASGMQIPDINRFSRYV